MLKLNQIELEIESNRKLFCKATVEKLFVRECFRKVFKLNE